MRSLAQIIFQLLFSNQTYVSIFLLKVDVKLIRNGITFLFSTRKCGLPLILNQSSTPFLLRLNPLAARLFYWLQTKYLSKGYDCVVKLYFFLIDHIFGFMCCSIKQTRR